MATLHLLSSANAALRFCLALLLLWSSLVSVAGHELEADLSTTSLAPAPGRIQPKSCSGRQTMMESCNLRKCRTACVPQSCVFGQWGSWSAGDCTGLCERERSILRRNNQCGTPCMGSTIESTRCQEKCGSTPVDCSFGSWALWTGIGNRLACIGGETRKMRTRAIVDRSDNGGAACLGDELEMAGCPIPEPVHCVLAEWDDWGDCSASCGQGERVRNRGIEVPSKRGGVPCTGQLTNAQACASTSASCPIAADCVWGDWASWSACARSCGAGQMTRDRMVKVSPKGGGALCTPRSKTQIAPCNTQPCDQDVCVNGTWDSWIQWGACSSPCGGGVSWRSRRNAVEANSCGIPAMGRDREAKSCNTQSCSGPPMDCAFSVWSEWGDCSCTEDGVKRRTRNIAIYGTGSGLWCNGDTQQVAPCNACKQTGVCQRMKAVDCSWGAWMDSSDCSVTCGAGQRQRHREVRSLAKHGGKPCKGASSVVELCQSRPCDEAVSRPCVWNAWTEWGACDKCGGQRKRIREIFQLPKGKGRPCVQDDSVQVQKCERQCNQPTYCDWTSWVDQEICSVSCGTGFVIRVRHLEMKDDASTRRLSAASEQTDVAVAHDDSCDGHQSQRFSCTMDHCPLRRIATVNCMLTTWSDWSSSDCTGLCERHRGIAQPNNEHGIPCQDSVVDTKRCETTCHEVVPVQCLFGSWSAWAGQSEGDAGLACHNGETQQVRQRKIMTPGFLNGGGACAGTAKETAPCPAKPALDCMLSGWAMWSSCSVSCGSGQRNRTRAILQMATQSSKQCDEETLVETDACQCASCQTDIDCVWGEWDAWSACTCSCGGGQRSRDRAIAVAPKGAGHLCPAKHRTEVSPCSTQSCDDPSMCVDGLWGQWSAFGLCSVACGGGLQWRMRGIATEATVCGQPAVGVDKDVRSCDTQSCAANQDCVFSSWSSWGDCSFSIDGVKSRIRSVTTYGSGTGVGCRGALKEVSPCNICRDLGVCPTSPPAVDCQMGAWNVVSGPSGDCSSSCGSGQRQVQREIIQQALHGGAPCDGSLLKVEACSAKPCVTGPKGCVWEPWQDWGVCDKCGGERKRSRWIQQMPEHGGAPCDIGASEEIADCPRQCHEEFTCEWSPWQDDSNCSAVCGDGVIRRVRHLNPVPVKRSSFKSSVLYNAKSKMRFLSKPAARLPEAMLAFICGSSLSLAAIFFLPRASGRVLETSGYAPVASQVSSDGEDSLYLNGAE